MGSLRLLMQQGPPGKVTRQGKDPFLFPLRFGQSTTFSYCRIAQVNLIPGAAGRLCFQRRLQIHLYLFFQKDLRLSLLFTNIYLFYIFDMLNDTLCQKSSNYQLLQIFRRAYQSCHKLFIHIHIQKMLTYDFL